VRCGCGRRTWQPRIKVRGRLFDPVIADDLAEEARLCAAYTETIAAARLTLPEQGSGSGTTINLNGLAPYQQHADRAVRRAAERARWDFFAGAGARLDAIFDALVRLRHGMARKLGLADFTALGYLRMRRVDYGRLLGALPRADPAP
jgi:oligoendopeptidase F